eukprot:scpid33981/ scgid10539/ 
MGLPIPRILLPFSLSALFVVPFGPRGKTRHVQGSGLYVDVGRHRQALNPPCTVCEANTGNRYKILLQITVEQARSVRSPTSTAVALSATKYGAATVTEQKEADHSALGSLQFRGVLGKGDPICPDQSSLAGGVWTMRRAACAATLQIPAGV